MSEQKTAFSRALKSTEAGDYEAALREFVWLHDNPNPDDPSSEMFRRANGFLAWAILGTKYPAAKVKMVDLLEQKKAHLQVHPDDKFVAADAGAMQQALDTYET